MSNVFKPHRGNANIMANQKKNIVLEAGEMFIELPNEGEGKGPCKMKIGDGTRKYSSLPYAMGDTSNDKISFENYDNYSNARDALIYDVKPGNALKTIINGLKNAISVTHLRFNRYENYNGELNTVWFDDDLNNYTEQCICKCFNANDDSILNAPSDNFGILRVYATADGPCQIWYEYPDPIDENIEIYVRRFYGGDWSPWKKLGSGNLPFELGISGSTYGYYKVGADTLTPFKDYSLNGWDTLVDRTNKSWNNTYTTTYTITAADREKYKYIIAIVEGMGISNLNSNQYELSCNYMSIVTSYHGFSYGDNYPGEHAPQSIGLCFGCISMERLKQVNALPTITAKLKNGGFNVKGIR